MTRRHQRLRRRLPGRTGPAELSVRALLRACAMGVLLLQGCAVPEQSTQQKRVTVLAVIDGESITQADLEHEILQRYYSKASLAALVRKFLFQRAAQSWGVSVDPQQLRERVEEELIRLAGGVGQKDFLAEDLRARGLEWHDAQREVTRQLRDQLLIDALVRKWRVVTEEDIRRAYEQSYRETRVLLSHIALQVPQPTSDTALTQTLQRAQALRHRIVEGESFAEVARAESDFEDTRSQGGRIGWISRNQLSPDTATVVFETPPGGITAPILQESVVHLFLVEQRQESQPLEQVRAELLQRLQDAAATTTELAALEDELRRDARITLFWEQQVPLGSESRKSGVGQRSD